MKRKLKWLAIIVPVLLFVFFAGGLGTRVVNCFLRPLED